MKATLSLRKPTNWQDFETLVKKLWGEIWQCPEIRKNGRSGNNQHGVDVYGIPKGENQYFGIQCKGKDEYTDQQFTENEIKEEITKAKTFEPSLKKFYLTTTAVKNSKIEEFVRKINVDHLNRGLFGVEIFAWEDIVDLIDENVQTHDWYVKSQNFKTRKSVSLLFQEGSSELNCFPKFRKVIFYQQKDKPKINSLTSHPFMKSIEKVHSIYSPLNFNTHFLTTVNLSFCKFCVKLHNTGNSPIEEYKIILQFDGDIEDIVETNEKSSFPLIVNPNSQTIFISSVTKEVQIVPKRKILVCDDTYVSDDIYIKTLPKDSIVNINWKLLSKDFQENGQLKLIIKPQFERKFIVSKDQAKIETNKTFYEDYITEETDE